MSNQRGSHFPQKPKHRPRSYRPRLEILEDRLPPGDMVLGTLLAGMLTEPASGGWDSLPSLSERSTNARPSGGLRPLHQDISPFQEEGDPVSVLPAYAAPGTVREHQPDQERNRPATESSEGFNFGWDALSLLPPAQETSQPVAPAGSSGSVDRLGGLRRRRAGRSSASCRPGWGVKPLKVT
jgi:hypothetical protein